jgi:hypothetical protein
METAARYGRFSETIKEAVNRGASCLWHLIFQIGLTRFFEHLLSKV